MDNGKRPLPEGWRSARLGELITQARNGLYKPDEFYGRGVPILKMFNIGRLDGKWVTERVDSIQLNPEEEQLYRLLPGDILVNRVNSRELVGKCAVVDQAVAGSVFESKNMRVRLDPAMADASFVAGWLNSDGGRSQVARRLKQIVGQATVNRTDLNSIEVPLPPVAEQKRIAAILNEQIAAVGWARAAAETQLEAAKALPAAYLRAVFDSPEAQKWPRKRLLELAQLQRGRFSPRPRNDPRYYGGPYPWVQIGEVESAEKYITTHRNTLNDQGLAVSKMFSKGTLVISIAATIGAVGILTFDSCMPDSLVGITPRPGLSDTEFLYYILLFVRGHLESVAPQMAQANLKLELLNPLEVPAPPLGEQQRVAATLNEQSASAGRARKALEERLETINRLPTALLHRAFSGEM